MGNDTGRTSPVKSNRMSKALEPITMMGSHLTTTPATNFLAAMEYVRTRNTTRNHVKHKPHASTIVST
jgi:hypothetical protein